VLAAGRLKRNGRAPGSSNGCVPGNRSRNGPGCGEWVDRKSG
jgi:hypothetical protein